MGLRWGGPFRPIRGRPGAVRVLLDGEERAFVADLLDGVAHLLDQPDDGADGSDTDVPDTDVPDTVVPDTDPDPTGEPPTVGEDDLWAALEASLTVSPPSDPAVARLLPDGSRDDAELSQSFRRLTEQSLRTSKLHTLGLAAAALRRDDPLVLTAEEATALMKAVNDLRLVLAERLGLRTDEDAESLHQVLSWSEGPGAADGPGRDQWLRLARIYEAMTEWQGALIAAVS